MALPTFLGLKRNTRKAIAQGAASQCAQTEIVDNIIKIILLRTEKMPNPYSYDLREKALNAVDRGHRKSNVCLSPVSRNTLYLWLKLREETGDFLPLIDYHREPKPKIDDLKAFEEFAQNHGHLTHQEMALKWHQLVSKTRIGQALKKIGFSRKKKLIVIKKELKN